MADVIKDYIITFLLGAGLAGLSAWVVSLKKKVKATQTGMQALLRADIIRSYDKYTDQGYCPIYARDALEKEYESYHALGGNGTITDLWERIQRLPTEKEDHNA